jgi:hypothetical protein
MKKGLLFGVLVLFALVFIMPYQSQAVPSFARQVKKPCTACHTVWGNLNQYGRQFKVKAYTDVNQDWEMINKDNMNLMTISPFSTRVVLEPWVRDNAPGTPPGSTTPGSTSDVNQVAIFMASRIFDYAGVFTSAEADGFASSSTKFDIPTVKVAFQYPLGEGNTIGLVSFAGLAASADPFNAIGGRDRDLIFDDGTPFILNTGWTFNFWSASNLGEVLHGYFLGNRLYAAVGVMRGGDSTEGTLTNGVLVNDQKSDPNDMYARIAWDQKLPNGAITFGVVNYNGTQRILDVSSNPAFDSTVKRTYVDLSLEQNYGEDHIVEVQALYGGGKDDNVFNGGEERKFSGSWVQADYYYERTYGVIAAINTIKYKDVALSDQTLTGLVPIDKQNQWIVGLNYLPWLNTKLAIQQSSTKTTNLDGTSSTDRISRVILDVLF